MRGEQFWNDLSPAERTASESALLFLRDGPQRITLDSFAAGCAVCTMAKLARAGLVTHQVINPHTAGFALTREGAVKLNELLADQRLLAERGVGG